MWTYIIRRLIAMLPTLFGVTVVSFVVMQMAPGDPLLSQLGPSGTAGQTGQTREAFLIQKRDLKLDKPLLFNTRYFQDYRDEIRFASHYWVMSKQEIADELEEIAAKPSDPQLQQRLDFLESLDIPDFSERLNPPDLSDRELELSGLTRDEWIGRIRQKREGLAQAIHGYLQVWCEDLGSHGVPPAVEMLRSEKISPKQKIGAIKCLNLMVVNPFLYTVPRDGTEQDIERVVVTWKLLWEQEQDRFSEVDPDRAEALQKKLAEMASASRSEMFKTLQSGTLSSDDAPFFANILLSEDSPRAEKVVAAEFLRLYISQRVKIDLPPSAEKAEVQQVSENWIKVYESNEAEYHHGFIAKLISLFTDTQYAHMVRRLVTFQFGRSALKPYEHVSKILWEAFLVSAPLMLMAELVIYFLAIPLGVLCSVNRANAVDRSTSFVLFFLYSVPPFVAGMMFLLFFCYGSYVKWFPMEGLHSTGAENFGFVQWTLDYLWHATLPVICLSLFSLAGMAMYSRTAMLDVLGQDYIRTARAKGLPWSKVIFKHAFRNGLIPIITLFASFLPMMLGGSVLIEYIFNIPGLGRLGFNAIEQKDFPTLMALIYIQAIVVMLSILLTDILYVFADPRISFGGQGED